MIRNVVQAALVTLLTAGPHLGSTPATATGEECPVLATLGQTLPDIDGVMEIGPDGDVTIVFPSTDPTEPPEALDVWECPPYGS